MNNKERQLVELLKDLKENFCLIGIKTEFEAEGAQVEEICRLKDITSKADVGITLKIGGCEGATGIKTGKVLGVSRIVAPMIESPFALKKFVKCVQRYYSPDELEDIELGINIETITGYNQYDAMLEIPEYSALSSIVFARADFVGSLGKPMDIMDLQEIQNYAIDVFRKTKAKNPETECVVGGVPSVKSLDFLKGIGANLLDGYEGRKPIFKSDGELGKKAIEGFAKGAQFEILWSENKANYYGTLSRRDEDFIGKLKANYDYAMSLL